MNGVRGGRDGGAGTGRLLLVAVLACGPFQAGACIIFDAAAGNGGAWSTPRPAGCGGAGLGELIAGLAAGPSAEPPADGGAESVSSSSFGGGGGGGGGVDDEDAGTELLPAAAATGGGGGGAFLRVDDVVVFSEAPLPVLGVKLTCESDRWRRLLPAPLAALAAASGAYLRGIGGSSPTSGPPVCRM